MCGILGFITAEKYKASTERRRIIEQGLSVGQLRGEDATGVFFVVHVGDNVRSKAGWVKNAVQGADFVRDKDFKAAMFNVDKFKFMVGHNRFGTQGSKTKVDNAHPFHEGPITLVHNGSLLSTHNLPISKYSLETDVEVDSHVIAHNLATSTVEEVVSKLDGAYALVWHDQRDDSLNMIRNEQRPLVLAKDRDSDTLYFASEAMMLAWLAERNNIFLENYVQPKPGRWLKFVGRNVILPIITDLPMYTYSRNSNYTVHQGFHYENGWVPPHNRTMQSPATPQHKGSGTSVLPFVQGPSGPPPKSPVNLKSGGAAKREREQLSIGQTSRTSTDLLKKIMHKYNVHETDTYAFTPKQVGFVSYSSAYFGRVEGTLDDATTAWIYNVNARSYNENKYIDWVVRPVGVIELDKDIVVICAVVKFVVPNDYKFVRFYDNNVEETTVTTSRDERVQTLMDVLEDNTIKESSKRTNVLATTESSSYLRGPGRVLIQRQEWMTRTKDGCADCACKLEPKDDEAIVWLRAGPICPACVQDKANELILNEHDKGISCLH